MKEKKFVMLGVIHRDERDPLVLAEWMERIGPDVITLEFSNYGLAFRKERGKEYRGRIDEVLKGLPGVARQGDKGSLEALYSYFDLPHEFKAASRYSSEHATPLYLVDMDMFSSLKLRKVDELVSRTNVEKLLSEENGGSAGPFEETAARLFFEKGVTIVSYTDEMCIRDTYMSNRIAVLMKYYGDKRFLHICGWQHLQDPCNVYSPLNPVKVFFHDKTFRI
jgi:hypothetical protein